MSDLDDADALAVRVAARSIGRRIMLVCGAVVLGALAVAVAYVVDQSIPQERLEQIAAARDGRVFIEAGDVLVGIVVLGLLGVVLAGLVTVVIARRAVRPLGEALRRQRQFVADASHELRTPLAVLDARLQALERRIRSGSVHVDDAAAVEIARLRADSGVLVDVVGDLLLAAGSSGGSADSADRPTAVPVADVVDEVLASMRVLAERSEVALRSESRATGADAVASVSVPYTSLRRAVLALVDNAVVHSPAGGAVTVRVRVAPSRPRDLVLVSVTDEGRGMSDIDPARVFDRFAHADAVPRADGTSTDDGRDDRPRFGIGLALVRDIVDRHGGSVRVAATSADGTTMEIALPLIRR